MTVTIRAEDPADIPAIRDVVVAAFGRDMEAELVDRLRGDGDGVISLVAVEGGRIVGHVLFSRMSAPFRALGLAPDSVAPARQPTGNGSGLKRAGQARSARDGWHAMYYI